MNDSHINTFNQSVNSSNVKDLFYVDIPALTLHNQHLS